VRFSETSGEPNVPFETTGLLSRARCNIPKMLSIAPGVPVSSTPSSTYQQRTQARQGACEASPAWAWVRERWGSLAVDISPQPPHSAPAKSEWRAPEDFVKSRRHLPDGLHAPVVLPPTLHDGPGLPPARKHKRGAHLEHIQLQRAGPRVLIARRSTRAGADRRCQSERSKARARGARSTSAPHVVESQQQGEEETCSRSGRVVKGCFCRPG